LYVLRYDVMFFFRYKSLISMSTPGGTERGVLPSLEGRFVVAEKLRLASVWKAGTRKPGNVTVDGAWQVPSRCRACLPILGASIVGDGGLRDRDTRSDRVWMFAPVLKKEPTPAKHRWTHSGDVIDTGATLW
jgi:hypothetical protein